MLWGGSVRAKSLNKETESQMCVVRKTLYGLSFHSITLPSLSHPPSQWKPRQFQISHTLSIENEGEAGLINEPINGENTASTWATQVARDLQPTRTQNVFEFGKQLSHTLNGILIKLGRRFSIESLRNILTEFRDERVRSF